jgi:DNA-binding NarL/FixJ family response regulator
LPTSPTSPNLFEIAYRNSIDLTDAVHPFAVPIAKIAHYLSNKEKGVIKLIAESYQNNGNAQMLNISVRTVEKHRANIIEKLGLHSGAGVTVFAYNMVWLLPNQGVNVGLKKIFAMSPNFKFSADFSI